MPEADDSSFDSQIASSETRSMLVREARLKGVPESDCDDIASETILRAYKSKASFNSTRASLTTWLRVICAKVIRNYFRRAGTQKRNAPGGLVSLDDVPEPRDENTRQAEHDVVDRANLSKKERDSVRLSLRGAKKHGIATKVSSSTIHRATEKIEQIRSDDRFEEQPHGPDPVECGYGTVPRAQHGAALLYDFSRATSWFVEAIKRWRKTPQWNEIQSHLRDERNAKRFPLTVPPRDWPAGLYHYYRKANEYSPQLRRRFAAAIEIALTFPEWPSVPYCGPGYNERRHRLESRGLPTIRSGKSDT
jgi:DNA-directed RNA polymerase specialized sigma24 family protein